MGRDSFFLPCSANAETGADAQHAKKTQTAIRSNGPETRGKWDIRICTSGSGMNTDAPPGLTGSARI